MIENNPLSTLNYRFKLTRTPQLSYRCQSVVLPGVSLGSIEVPSPFTRIPLPGNIQYDDLSLSFIVGEGMQDYNEILTWIVQLGQPARLGSYPERTSDAVSDGSLMIMNSQYQTISTFTFYDMFPTSLSPITFDSTQQNVTYAHCSATFKYLRFEVKTA